MTYGGHAYGSTPYASGAGETVTTVDLAPGVLEFAGPTIPPVTQQPLAPGAVEFVAPVLPLNTQQPLAPGVLELAGPTIAEPTYVALAPGVIDLVGPPAIGGGADVDLAPGVIEFVAPTIPLVSQQALAPGVLELAGGRFRQVVLIQPWTADDAASTAFVMEVQIEVDVDYTDPTAESGWQPIRTNRVTWPLIAVDPDTGRPTSPDSPTESLAPGVVEFAAPVLEF